MFVVLPAPSLGRDKRLCHLRLHQITLNQKPMGCLHLKIIHHGYTGFKIFSANRAATKNFQYQSQLLMENVRKGVQARQFLCTQACLLVLVHGTNECD